MATGSGIWIVYKDDEYENNLRNGVSVENMLEERLKRLERYFNNCRSLFIEGNNNTVLLRSCDGHFGGVGKAYKLQFPQSWNDIYF